METYTTIQGDMWDSIAFKTLGNERYMNELIQANVDYLGTVVFSGGVILRIPKIDRKPTINLPPWKR